MSKLKCLISKTNFKNAKALIEKSEFQFIGGIPLVIQRDKCFIFTTEDKTVQIAANDCSYESLTFKEISIDEIQKLIC